WYIHSFRETMLAYAALVRYRQSERAAESGRRAVRRMARVCADPRKADFHPTLQPYNTSHPVYFHGRAIEGLLRFYQATGDEAALELAGRLAAYHLENMTREDGSLGEDPGNHTHSYLNTLRGLLLYGQLTRQRRYIDTVYTTYKNAVAKRITPAGFIYHDMDISGFAVGEVASAGDVAQLALWLYHDTHDPELLDDVERIVRSRLLPSQIDQTPRLVPMETSDGDDLRALSRRIVGALGGVAGHTWGKSCVTDITAATLHSLIDVAHHITEKNETGIWVQLHFDCTTPYVRIESTRADDARLAIHVPGEEDLFVRIPGWAPIDSVKLVVDGKQAPIRRHGTYLFVPGSSCGLQVEIRYDLPRRTTKETSRMRYYQTPDRAHGPAQDPIVYTLRWRGDEVVSASPVGDFFPIYPLQP
ncbi:MAG: beta-L-arabinofuranosidase domain-containing protein, partial [Pirellulaceae bacterium]